MSTELLSLHDGWTVRPVAGPVPARGRRGRPGAGDRAGLGAHRPAGGRLHPGPLPRRQRAAARLDRADRTGATRRPSTGRPVAATASELVFDGLDTVATVELNGDVVGAHARTCTAPTGSTSATVLQRGRQHACRSRSPRRSATPTGPASSSERGRTSTTTRTTRSARWPATSAGTGARTWSTAGIWRPVTLQSWRTARLAAVRPVVDVDGARGRRRRPRRRGAGRRRRAPSTVDGDGRATPTGTLTARRRARPSGVVSLVVDDVRAVVAARARRPAAVRPRRAARGRRRRAARRRGRRGSASARCASMTEPDDDGTELHLRRQRPAGLRQGRQLDPRRRLPAPGRPGALRRPAGAGRGGRRQPAAGLGRRHLRGRRLLRRVRRARADGLAGLPVRLRRLQRGGAAALRGRSPRRATT